jgi:Flp pilus assembly secretin CpaC
MAVLVLGITLERLHGAESASKIAESQQKTVREPGQRQADVAVHSGKNGQVVRLQVLVAELSLTKLRASGDALDVPVVKTPPPSSAADRLFKNIVEPLAWITVDENDPLLKKVEGCVGKGHARLLSATTLTTAAGTRVWLHRGGEVPYLESKTDGQVNVEWKRYGTCLEAVPEVVDKTISLDLRVSVSEIDKENSLAAEQKIPALRVLTDVGATTKSKLGQVLVFFGPRQHRTVEERPSTATATKPEPNAQKACEEEQTLVLIRPQYGE